MVSNLEGQLGGPSNPNANKKYRLPKSHPCNATLYVFLGNENAIDSINFLINVEDVHGRELPGLGSLILQSDRPQKFVPLINWTNVSETFATGVFTYSKEVIKHLQEPATIPLPNCNTRFTFNNVTVVSGSPWDAGCDTRAPRAYSEYNDRIDNPRPRVHSTTKSEEVERLILNAVFEAVCGFVSGKDQPPVASWRQVTEPYTYLPAPYQNVSLER